MRGRSRARSNNKNKARGVGVKELCGGAYAVGLGAMGLALASNAALAQIGAGAAGGGEAAPVGAVAAAGPAAAVGPAAGLAGLGTAPGAFGAFGPPPAPATAIPAAAVTPLEIPAVPPAWLLTPGIQLGEAFNDNVNLTPRGSHVWDFITTITPSLTLVGQTARVNLNFTYDPQELIFAHTSPTTQLQQRLAGNGRAEVITQALYIEGSASIDQAFIRNTGAIVPTTLTNSSNLQTVYAESVSPYLLQHLGSYADSESRYRFSSVSTSGGVIAPETTHELRQTFLGGEAFGRFGWQLLGDATRLERGQAAGDALSGITSKDELISAAFKYPVYKAVSAVAGIGYERISDPTLAEQPKSLIWNVGFTYEPNPLVAVTLTYGNRFNRSDIEFNTTYNLDPQLRLSAVYTQTIQTSQSQIAGNLVTNPNGSTSATNTTAVNTVPINSPFAGTTGGDFGISSGSFLSKTAELDAALTKERNTYSTRIYLTKESGGATVVNGAPVGAASVTAERVFGGTVDWNHLLRPDLTANAGAGYYRAMFLDGSGRRDDVYTLSIGVTYNLSRTATATLSLLRSDQRSNIPADNIIDDIVMATIQKQF